jgi:hypothetical protein
MTRWHEFTETDWSRLETDWTDWWSGKLKRPLVTVVTADADARPEAGDDFLTRFPVDMPVEAIIANREHRLDRIHYYGDAVPKYWVNFGAGIMGAFLGAGVEYNTGTTWFHELPLASLSDLSLTYDPDNFWWKRVQAVTQAAADHWAGRVVIAYTDLGGNLDILASLRGTQKLLMDLIDAPDEVERLIHEITGLWLRYFNELEALLPAEQRGRACWAPPWSPSKGYMLQSDFCYMISPAMFDRFVLPDLQTCCNMLDYCFYHMDGRGQLVHLDRLLSIENLRGIQWQPGDGQPLADGWLDVLRRIRESGKLCQVFVTLDGALKITRELGGEGFLFDIIDRGQTITPQQMETFFRELEPLI